MPDLCVERSPASLRWHEKLGSSPRAISLILGLTLNCWPGKRRTATWTKVWRKKELRVLILAADGQSRQQMTPNHNINHGYTSRTNRVQFCCRELSFWIYITPLSFKRSPGTRLSGMKPNINSGKASASFSFCTTLPYERSPVLIITQSL